MARKDNKEFSETSETSSCYLLHNCAVANVFPRIFVLRISEMLFAALEAQNSSDKRRQVLVQGFAGRMSFHFLSPTGRTFEWYIGSVGILDCVT